MNRYSKCKDITKETQISNHTAAFSESPRHEQINSDGVLLKTGLNPPVTSEIRGWLTQTSLAAVRCPDIETVLLENMVWRLISGAPGEFGAQVMLSCSPGFHLEGQRILRCLANGSWSGLEERSTCSSKTATHLCHPSISHLSISPPSITHLHF